ncbi:MAG: acyltransferase family protein, partial [Mycobacterium sp.]
FSLYMIHEPVHTVWNWAVQQYTITMPKSVAKIVVVGLIAAAVGAAMLLYHFVEEPARRWMRRMVDTRDVKGNRLQAVGAAREAPSAAPSTRAG